MKMAWNCDECWKKTGLSPKEADWYFRTHNITCKCNEENPLEKMIEQRLLNLCKDIDGGRENI